MAIVKVIELALNTVGFKKGVKEVEDGVEDISSVILEQTKILNEFERELNEVNRALTEIPKNNLPGIKQLTDRQTDLKNVIREQKTDLKGLNLKLKEEKDLQKGAAGSTKQHSEAMDGLDKATGGAVSSVRALIKSLTTMMANPYVALIGALVGVVMGLYKAFERTAEGSDFLETKLGGIGAMLGPLMDSFGKLAGGIVSLFSGEFEKAEVQFRLAFLGTGNAMKKAYEDNEKLVKVRRELNDLTRETKLEEAKLTKEIKQQAAITENSKLSIEERIAANERQKELAQELVDGEQKLLDKRIEEAKLEEQLAGDSDKLSEEAKDKQNELLIEFEQIQGRKELVLRRFYDTEERLINESIANQNRALKAEEEYLKQRNTTLGNSKSKAVEIEQNYTEAIKELAVQKTSVDNKILQNALSNVDKERDAAERLRDLKIGATMSTLNTIASLTNTFAGESEKQQRKAFKIQKAISMAQAAISTYQSANAAYLSQIIPGDPTSVVRGFVAAGVSIAAGLANVASIAKQQFNSSGGGFSGGGGSFSSSSIQQPNFNVIGASSTNQITSAINNQNSSPVKAYVVAGEVTTAQSLELNAIKTATFG